MISFESDYIQGAHPAILENLCRTNMQPLSGYGEDEYCASAKQKIKEACGIDTAEVQLLVGGTQTNQIVIASMLRLWEGVLAATTGHINVHEAGAIEYTGHKVLPLPGYEGKIKADDLSAYLRDFYADENHSHAVFPGMVYISHPTEYGTLYTKSELGNISAICREYGIPLFLDGARLGYGLMSDGTDVTLNDVARLCDVFYVGGTKVGALCGEAVVFTKNNMPKNFISTVKQHGALLAKGRLLGVQFDTLFTDGLYFEISANAIRQANRMREIFEGRGYEFFIRTTTNQVFIVLENSKMAELAKSVKFGFWEKADEHHTVVRFATSWATTDADIDALEALL